MLPKNSSHQPSYVDPRIEKIRRRSKNIQMIMIGVIIILIVITVNKINQRSVQILKGEGTYFSHMEISEGKVYFLCTLQIENKTSSPQGHLTQGSFAGRCCKWLAFKCQPAGHF